MITLLTSLKPFRGAAIHLQENSLANWRSLNPSVEIIVYGQCEGIDQRLRRYEIRHVPDIHSNERGVPDFSALAEHAAQHSRYDLQVYVNGDILLPPDFIRQLQFTVFKRFLITGQRIDLDRAAVFNPVAVEWRTAIAACADAGHATVHGPAGADYFAFPRGLWRGLPLLTVGRGSYDSALLAFCLRQGIPIVDATWSIPVVHQWHDYAHLEGTAEARTRADTMANKRRHDILHSNPDIEDASWRLLNGRVTPSRGSTNLLRRLEIILRYRMGLKIPSYACRAVTRLAWMCGQLQPRSLTVEAILGKASPLKREGRP